MNYTEARAICFDAIVHSASALSANANGEEFATDEYVDAALQREARAIKLLFEHRGGVTAAFVARWIATTRRAETERLAEPSCTRAHRYAE